MPMLVLMNAIAQASATPIRGPKLDNRRVLAGIVDLLIVALGGVVVLFAGDALSGDASEVRGALAAVVLGWALYYYFALESGGGQTVGKKLMKLRVVRADGAPAGMREVAVRTILRVVDGAGAYIVGLIVMLATGEKRQRIGDLAAGTIVVDATSPSFVPAVATPVAEPAPAEAGTEALDADAEADTPEADGDSRSDAAESAAASATITLPSRPEPPATVADLAAPEAPAVPEMRPFPPVDAPADEPVAEEALVEEQPAPVADPVTDELPDVTSPAVEELARDVASVQAELPAAEVAPELDVEQPIEAPVDEDGPVTVKSVETVSAIDLIMGGADEAQEGSQDSAGDAEDSA
jgi:uncharacterized RDD family membrane protein YckC